MSPTELFEASGAQTNIAARFAMLAATWASDTAPPGAYLSIYWSLARMLLYSQLVDGGDMVKMCHEAEALAHKEDAERVRVATVFAFSEPNTH